MQKPKAGLSRRHFVQASAAGIAAFTILPRNVLGLGETPPSEEIGGALIGCGGRGPGHVRMPRSQCPSAGIL